MSVINSKGFSLPEIIVALGLVAGISLITVKLMENQANNEAMIKFSAEIQKATARIKADMADKEKCRYMLGGKTIGEYASPASVGVAGIFSRVADHTNGTFSRVLLVRPDTKYQGFKTGDISLRYPANAEAVVALRNVAELVLTYRMETKSILFDDRDDANDRKTIRQVIPVIVKQSGNVISDCGPAVSDTNEASREKFCLSLGGMTRWTPGVAGAPGTCTFDPNAKCGWGTVPEFQSTTGTFTCVSVDTQMDPNALFNTTPCTIGATRKFSIISVGAKLQVQCL